MFGVMPSWTDILGAGLVLGTVISMAFEKDIAEKCDLKKICATSTEPTKDANEKVVR